MTISALAVAMLLSADAVTYRGRQVYVVDPGTDEDGFLPKAEAKVCALGGPEKGCYVAPKGFGREPRLTVVHLREGEPALFFHTASAGVSGWSIHFAVLEICNRDGDPSCGIHQFSNLLADTLQLSNQSQWIWWDLPEISESQIFLTADYVWGPKSRTTMNTGLSFPHLYDELTMVGMTII